MSQPKASSLIVILRTFFTLGIVVFAIAATVAKARESDNAAAFAVGFFICLGLLLISLVKRTY